ncbi:MULTISPECIES: glucosaminidase domain-containing protein [Anaerococcus]|uniref:glucosaminidase domain-containing protein n=1 Tax=Anaerococcus TaxID=165779 RepID=UPI0008A12D1D|nr:MULTISPECIES: glucosaminidase domain-containing protein [Anaerococcus]MBS6920419.1 glucosaminidase domain-containing protein [Anaerococcus vaginalis]MDU1763091.1 glucosaminidase domain-containing protein [Anaerococcus vaginalis]MDU4447456.1 glucosaminidase domain-containing protein [Anaerococcus vaginalis]MDU5987890.1 glucosaminidase domain-containing protein [Anaerococcus vaginalis]MDU6181569.1 glucosaminidase domain-containing protein [Anaerococcus vaginalis]
MNKKRFKISFLSFLAIVLVLVISTGLEKSSLAAKNKGKRDSLINGVNEISNETLTLRQSRIERFEKLEKDYKELNDKGSDELSKTSMLYLTNKTNLTAEELEYGLKNTNLQGLGKDFKKAEEKYEVNAILLMGMAKHETGNGHSYLAKTKNNLFGFNAIDQDPINSANTFKDKGESIDHVAKFLKENYLSEDGKYYNGISTKSIGKLYASDPEWSNKVDYMMREVCRNILQEK